MTFLVSLLIGLAAWAPLTTIDIVGNERADTLDRGGQNVRIGGQRNTITLTGSRPRVDITGSNNTIKIEALEVVDITGGANTVEWQRSLVGDRPRVSSTGFGNTVGIEMGVTEHLMLIVDSGHEATLDCGDGALLTLLGGGKRLTLTGTCRTVNVVGAGNQVWVERAHVIDVSGTANAVVWQSGPDDVTPPAVVVIGLESTVEQGALP